MDTESRCRNGNVSRACKIFVYSRVIATIGSGSCTISVERMVAGDIEEKAFVKTG
ncbi:MAG: hypothetical protein HQK92_00425 [Nitrospirae bacterium]|nr:hypothetical protein [Nitrospirota bacterium]